MLEFAPRQHGNHRAADRRGQRVATESRAVFAGMQDVRDQGLRAARHLDGEIWEVRVDGDRVIYRILFAPEGSRGQILLALEGLNKKTQKTPQDELDLARARQKEIES